MRAISAVAVLAALGCGTATDAARWAGRGDDVRCSGGWRRLAAHARGTGGDSAAAPGPGSAASGTGGAMHEVATGSGGMSGAAPISAGTGGAARRHGRRGRRCAGARTVRGFDSRAAGRLRAKRAPSACRCGSTTRRRSTWSSCTTRCRLHPIISSSRRSPIRTTASSRSRRVRRSAARSKAQPLAISQKRDDVIVLPDGVSYGLAALQVMNLELHYLNTASERSTSWPKPSSPRVRRRAAGRGHGVVDRHARCLDRSAHRRFDRAQVRRRCPTD